MLSPLELIEKLAALVPPPRLNLVRYQGVLSPNASERNQIVHSAFFGGAGAIAGIGKVVGWVMLYSRQRWSMSARSSSGCQPAPAAKAHPERTPRRRPREPFDKTTP